MSSCSAECHAGKGAASAPAVPQGISPGLEMRSNITSEAGISTHVNQWWSTVPLVTASILVTCVTVYVISLLAGYDSFFQVCSSPDFYVTKLQVYRAVTSVVFHQGLLHLALNMMALLPIACPLERLAGSLRLAHVVALFPFTNAAIDTFLSVAARMAFGYEKLFFECGIGFSGVIFSLLVIENAISPGSSRSMFGFFSVPAPWYPWILLVVFQLLMPQASFIGHLSGILSGLAYKEGYFAFLTPTSSAFSSAERLSFMSPIVRRSGFISGGSSLVTPTGPAGYSLPTTMSQLAPATGFSNISAAFSQSWRNFQSSLAQVREQWERQSQQQQQPMGPSVSAPGAPTTVQSAASGAGSFGLPSALRGMQTFGHTQAKSNEGGAQAPVDARFPGKGRTLSGVNALPQDLPQMATAPLSYPIPQNAATTAAASAALARATGRAPPKNPSGPTVPSSQQPRQDSTQEHQPALYSATVSSAGGLQSQEQQQGTPDSLALRQLLAMGFQKDAAETALAAANGDVGLAVEILSSA